MASVAVFARAVMATGEFMYFLVVFVAQTREKSEANVGPQGLEDISGASAMTCFHSLLGH